MKKIPSRLLNEMFFRENLPIRLNHHLLKEPFEIHWHEFYELTFVLSGEGVNTVNGASHSLKRGDLFLLTPADFHEIAPVLGGELELYNLIFSQHMLTDDLMRLLFMNELGLYAHLEKQQEFDHVSFRFESIRQEIDLHASGREIALTCDLHRVLLEWQRHRTHLSSHNDSSSEDKSEPLSVKYHSGIQQSLIYIQHHFRQPLSLEDAARQAHLSTNYFSDRFHKSTGMSFQHYLQQLRLQFACSLLRVSNLPITEICYASGFQTLTHFEKMFRQKLGMTPRDYHKTTDMKQNFSQTKEQSVY